MRLTLDQLWQEAVKDKPDLVPSDIRGLIQQCRVLEARCDHLDKAGAEYASKWRQATGALEIASEHLRMAEARIQSFQTVAFQSQEMAKEILVKLEQLEKLTNPENRK